MKTQSSKHLTRPSVAQLAVMCLTLLLIGTQLVQRPARALERAQELWTLLGDTGGAGVEALALASPDGQVILAGTQHKGLYRSANGGGTWSLVLDRAIGALAVAPSSPATVYAGTLGDGVFVSQDGGATWTPRSAGLLADDVYSLALDPGDAQVVMAGTEVGVFKTTSGGTSWQAASQGLAGRSIHALATVGGTWIAGCDMGAFRSTDAGQSWAPANQGLLGSQVHALAVASSSTLWAGTDLGVCYSTDQGQSWIGASQGLPDAPVWTLVANPADLQELYAGGGLGVYVTGTSGSSWAAWNEGLTGWALQVKALVLDTAAESARLIAGTGAGAWVREAQVAGEWQVYLPLIARQHVTGTVKNGGFERGDLTGWDHGGSLLHRAVSGDGHSGRYAALLGDPDVPPCQAPQGEAWIEQDLVVPAGAGARLSLWYRVFTYDQNRELADTIDHFDVWLNDERILRDANQALENSCEGPPHDLGWQHWQYDLSTYSGRVVTLRMSLTSTDRWWNTWVWVDDVEVLEKSPSPSPTATPTSTPEDELYFDDFGNPNSGWYVGETNTAKYAYLEGEYQILVKIQNGNTVLHAPTVRCSNCSVEVEARLATAGVAAYGLQFAASDDGYYLFRVRHNQQYELWKVIGGTWEQLVSSTSSPHINAGQAMNRLRVVRNGADILLYANDHHLTTLSDDSLSGEGRVGVHARTWSSENVDVRFDNFTVRSVTDGYPTATPTPTQTPTPTTTPVQTPSPTATQPTGPVLLYADDFEDPNSGWVVEDDENRAIGYSNGEYQIHFKVGDWWTGVPAPGFRCTDCAIEVDARFASTVQDACGIAFGIDSDWDAYLFLVSGARRYSLWKKQPGAWSALVPWTSSPYLNPGTMANRLRVVRSGTDIVLYTNGWHLQSVSDDSLTGSLRAGLFAETFGDPDMDVRFDNFAVYSAFDVHPTATPVQTPQPTPMGQLYFDDFSDPASGWYAGETNTARYAYFEGGYQILVKLQDVSTRVSAPSIRCTDCSVEVEARLATAGVAAYGLQFVVNDDDFYLFRVSHNQQYQLWKVVDGSWTALVNWTTSTHISAGQASNRLRVVRNGSDIAMYANDQHLATVSDDSLASDGRVGLHARTWSSENVDVRFDNFAVYAVNGGAGLATADPQAAGSDSSASEVHGSTDRSP